MNYEGGRGLKGTRNGAILISENEHLANRDISATTKQTTCTYLLTHTHTHSAWRVRERHIENNNFMTTPAVPGRPSPSTGMHIESHRINCR